MGSAEDGPARNHGRTWFTLFSLSSSNPEGGVCTFQGNTRAADAAGDSPSGSSEARFAFRYMLPHRPVSARRRRGAHYILCSHTGRAHRKRPGREETSACSPGSQGSGRRRRTQLSAHTQAAGVKARPAGRNTRTADARASRPTGDISDSDHGIPLSSSSVPSHS
jgi:hypothetical protein